MNILDKLGKERLFFDGAMGTMLQAHGLKAGELPDLWNITNNETILNIHEAYLNAGSDIINTNTFGANRLKLSEKNYSVEQIISSAVMTAKKAAEKTNAYVALDIGPTGKLLSPFGDLDFEEAVDIFAQMIKAGANAGADLILIETMSDTYEIKAALLAAKENSNLPVIVTLTADVSGRLLTGADIPTAINLIEGLGADALGLNCGHGPAQMKTLLDDVNKYAGIPIMISPNAGMPVIINGAAEYHITPEEFASEITEFASCAQIIGGCCGTTPEHIKAMIDALKDIPFTPAAQKNYTAVSSWGKTVFFGEKTVIIGERINPTGKPRMKKALHENDFDYICREGLQQAESGAAILDVNAGLPDIDEKTILSKIVKELQSVTDTVLQIDTTDYAVAESALRLYNGKPLFNSVNGKKESLEKFLPLVKKYGAVIVALTLDDNGIPETSEGRIDIAKKIISAATSYGIPEKNIIIDTLTMTVSTDSGNSKITLDALEHIRYKMGVHTILGVSNISFGLPERQKINTSFFTLAMRSGLSAGIINPLDTVMMDAYYAFNALNGADSNCGEYIKRFSKQISVQKSENGDLNLHDSILYGLREQAGKAANIMLADTSPMEIINNCLIPALDKIGCDYKNENIFLPQLLMSAEAAKTAFESIKIFLAKQGEIQEKRGKIMLLTVKGDIHDIGKNIVKVLLENYNFNVIDLGKNVEPSFAAQTVINENIRLVGLSALMTTTVVYMEETIRLIKEKKPDCHIMVGGAVLTQEYAEKIGSDYYAKDAMSGVRYADELFREDSLNTKNMFYI
ncbi:MAG: homocysteine S-methyltransferase family protein [Treponema sp.]|nr:homocysteine S-methyltransferase family protein [Treponema sp.]MCL2272495.1 homocysteine S-methyltransferase family protein [Treponema sp.]